MHQEHIVIFQEFLQKKSTHIEVQIARIGVCIAQEFQENAKRTKIHG